MKKVLIVVIIALLYGCSKDNPEVKSPNIIGNIYQKTSTYGLKPTCIAFIFISESKITIIHYYDNQFLQSIIPKPPLYEFKAKFENTYVLDFPNLKLKDDPWPKGEFSSDAEILTYSEEMMVKVDVNSAEGIFLNSVK
jgi:hypothetical protein